MWSPLGPGTVSCPVMEDSVMSDSPLGWLLTNKKKQKIVSVGKDAGKLEPLCTAALGNVK